MATTSPQSAPSLRGFPVSSSNYRYFAGQLQQPPTSLPDFSWHYSDATTRSVRVKGGVGVVFILAVLSLLLLLAIIFLYSRWACRYRHMAPGRAGAAGGGSAAEVDGNTGEPVSPEVVKEKGLTNEEISRLPVVQIKGRSASSGRSSGDQELQCSICLGGLTEVMKVLPGCGHGFHTECADLWLQLHASCPLCRASLQLGPLRTV